MMEIMGLLPAPSCLSGTSGSSKVVGDATSPAQALATTLHFSKNAVEISEALISSSETRNPTNASTRYRQTLCDPKFLSLISSSEDSGVELQTETEAVQGKTETQGSEPLQVVKSPYFTDSTDVASLFAPIENYLNSSTELKTFRVEAFTLHRADGTSQQLWALVENIPRDRGVRFCTDLFNLEARNDLHALIMNQYIEPPNVAHLKSFFAPNHSLKCLKSGESPDDIKTWKLGFNTRIYSELCHKSKHKRTRLERYTLCGTHRTFEAFQEEWHKFTRYKQAWTQIISHMDPAQHTGPLSPGFEKLASDFFSGKEVKSVLAYQSETDLPPTSSTASKTYVISYGNSIIPAEVRAQLVQDEEFCRFMADVVMSNELQQARANNTKYWDANVVDLKVNDKSQDIVIKAFVQTLRAKYFSHQSSSECNVSAPLKLSSFGIQEAGLDRAESNSIPSVQNNEFSNLALIHPSPNANGQSKLLSEDKDGDEWMNKCEDHETEVVPKKAEKKAKKSQNKVSKKYSKLNSKFDIEPEEKSPFIPEPEALASATDSKPLESIEDSLLENCGDWSVVQAKLPPRQGRALNSSSTGAINGTTSSWSGRQTRAAGPLMLQKNPVQISLPHPTSAKIQRQGVSNTTTSKNTAQKPLVVPKADAAAPHKTVDAQARKKFVKIKNPVPKEAKGSRTFIPEQHPNFHPKLSEPISSTAVTPSSQIDHKFSASAPPPAAKPKFSASSAAQHVEDSSVSHFQPENPCLPAEMPSKPEMNPVATMTGPPLTTLKDMDQASDGDIFKRIPTKANDDTLYSAAGGSPPVASHVPSDNFLTSHGHDGTTLESRTHKDFDDETFPQLLVKPEEAETAEGVDHSEISSTTLQGDIVQNEEVQKSDDGKKKEDMSTTSDGFEDQEMSSAENYNGHPSEDVETAESESSEDTSSDVGIVASHSQRNGIPMFESTVAFNGDIDERVSSEFLQRIIENPAQSKTTIHLENVTSKVSRNMQDVDQEDSSISHDSEDSQNVDEPTSSLREDNSIPNLGFSIQIANYTVGKHGRLLLTEDEAARVVPTRKTKIRSARYAPSTGATNIPNFYYLSSDDEGSDAETTGSIIQVQNSAMNTAGQAFRMSGASPYTQASASPMYMTATGFRTTLSLSGAIESQELAYSGHSESTHHETAVLDLRTASFLPETNHTIKSSYSDSKSASVTDATVSDIQNNSITHSGDHAHTLPPSSNLESMAQEPVMDATASNLQTSLPTSDGNQTQAPTQSSHRFSAPNPAPTVSHTLQNSAHPAATTHLHPVSQQDSHSQQNEASPTGESNASFQNTDSSGVPNHVVSASMASTVSQFTAYCTYCRERTDPSLQTPQVLCSGCGPTSMIRYCSVACLLVDSFAHSGHCINYAVSDRAAFHNLPSSFFVYIQNPIMPELGYIETPERFRQRAFSMYCSSGPFPKLSQSWVKRPGVVLTAQTSLDPNEDFKRTGDYAVFRSDCTIAPPRNNANADVIFTIKFLRDDPKRMILNRTLNSCFYLWDSRIVEFLYRFLRNTILDSESFSIFKYADPADVVYYEFKYQFQREFQWDKSMQTVQTPFNLFEEWNYISRLVASLEYQNPVLAQWFQH